MRSTPGCSSRTETCRCAFFFWGFFCVTHLSHVGLHGTFWAFKSTGPMRGMSGCSSRTETCRCAFFFWGYSCVIHLSHVGLQGTFRASKSAWPGWRTPGCSPAVAGVPVLFVAVAPSLAQSLRAWFPSAMLVKPSQLGQAAKLHLETALVAASKQGCRVAGSELAERWISSLKAARAQAPSHAWLRRSPALNRSCAGCKAAPGEGPGGGQQAGLQGGRQRAGGASDLKSEGSQSASSISCIAQAVPSPEQKLCRLPSCTWRRPWWRPARRAAG